jgi:hypothetical protein
MEFIGLREYERRGGIYDDAGNGGESWDDTERLAFVDAIVADRDEDMFAIAREAGVYVWCDSTQVRTYLVQATGEYRTALRRARDRVES